MALDKKQLEKFRELLLEEKQEILDDISDSVEEYESLNNASSGGDIVDQAYNFWEKGQLIELSDRERETLGKIEEALRRIDKGTYGICEITGQEIELERLEAIPYTTICAEEAQKKAKQHIPR